MGERGRRATEAIEIIRKFWTGGRFDYDGRIFKLTDADMLPTPVQPGGVPIWVSAVRTHRCGVRQHWATAGIRTCTPRSGRGSRSCASRRWRTKAGRILPKDYVFACFIYVSLHDDVDIARRRAVDEMTYRYNQDFSDLVDKYCAYGPPERVAEYLTEFVDAGANYLILAPIMPPASGVDISSGSPRS